MTKGLSIVLPECSFTRDKYLFAGWYKSEECDGERYNEVQDMILSDFEDDIIDTFEYSYITTNRSLILEEVNLIYEITSTNCSYIHPNLGRINLVECEPKLKNVYGFEQEDPLYILKLDAFVEGKTGSLEQKPFLRDLNLKLDSY